MGRLSGTRRRQGTARPDAPPSPVGRGRVGQLAWARRDASCWDFDNSLRPHSWHCFWLPNIRHPNLASLFCFFNSLSPLAAGGVAPWAMGVAGGSSRGRGGGDRWAREAPGSVSMRPARPEPYPRQPIADVVIAPPPCRSSRSVTYFSASPLSHLRRTFRLVSGLWSGCTPRVPLLACHCLPMPHAHCPARFPSPPSRVPPPLSLTQALPHWSM